MSGPMLVEAVADATLAYIRDHQTAKLTDVQARGWAVDVGDLTDFQALRFSDPLREHDSVFPALYCTPEGATIAGTKGYGAVNTRQRWGFWVVAYAPGSIEEGLTPADHVKRKLARYCLAVWEMLIDMGAGNDPDYYANGARVLWATDGVEPKILYGATYTNANGEYFADARLEIGTEVLEASAT